MHAWGGMDRGGEDAATHTSTTAETATATGGLMSLLWKVQHVVPSRGGEGGCVDAATVACGASALQPHPRRSWTGV